MRGFQNKLLIKLFKSQRDELKKEGRNPLSEELNDVHFLLCNRLIMFFYGRINAGELGGT
jgi:hypothetical protein